VTAPALLAAALSFTLPAYQRVPATCGAGPDSLRNALQWTASVRRQSPAWIAMRPAMLADAGVWAALWPVVAREAALQTVAQGAGAAGQRVTTTPADTLTGVRWYSVTTNNGMGESCVSNVVGKP
jgi:hypothetical protein